GMSRFQTVTCHYIFYVGPPVKIISPVIVPVPVIISITKLEIKSTVFINNTVELYSFAYRHINNYQDLLVAKFFLPGNIEATRQINYAVRLIYRKKDLRRRVFC